MTQLLIYNRCFTEISEYSGHTSKVQSYILSRICSCSQIVGWQHLASFVESLNFICTNWFIWEQAVYHVGLRDEQVEENVHLEGEASEKKSWTLGLDVWSLFVWMIQDGNIRWATCVQVTLSVCVIESGKNCLLSCSCPFEVYFTRLTFGNWYIEENVLLIFANKGTYHCRFFEA